MAEPHSIDSLSDEAFGWYFTGLADGESSFALTPSLDKRTINQTVYWYAAFRLAMRDDETENIKAVARRMKCGTLYKKRYTPAMRARWAKNGKPSFCWNVSASAELASIIVPHFERFPLQFKKARDFQIWKQAVPILVNGARRAEHGRHPGKTLTDEERAFLEALAAQLKAVRQYVSPEIEKPPLQIIPSPPKEEYPLFPS